MTLLIGLMLNYLLEHVTGAQWCDPGWIVALWVLHILYHSESKK